MSHQATIVSITHQESIIFERDTRFYAEIRTRENHKPSSYLSSINYIDSQPMTYWRQIPSKNASFHLQ